LKPDIRNIVVLTGAGVSAESGLATSRGPDGLWEATGSRAYALCKQNEPAPAINPLRAFALRAALLEAAHISKIHNGKWSNLDFHGLASSGELQTHHGSG
jgi:hypothetical protein